MRKIILDNIIFSLQRSGGISTVWENIIRRILVDNRFETTFIDYKESLQNIFRKKLDIPDSLVIQKSDKFLPLKRYYDVRYKMGEEHVFHSSYYRLSKESHAKNITTVHDFTYEYYCRNIMARECHKWQKYKAILKADKVVCVSENTMRDLLHFVPEAKNKEIKVIYNGVSEEYRVLNNRNKEYEDYVLFVGAREGYKNFLFLVDAIKDTYYKLLICGRPLTELEERVLNNSLGKERYKIQSDVSNYKLNEIYNSVLCLVYPSSYEGFGIPVVEAQKAGCPVIALNVSSIPEIIGDTPLLLDALDRNALLEKIAMAEKVDIRDIVISSGLENAKRFSWDKVYEQYALLYSTI